VTIQSVPEALAGATKTETTAPRRGAVLRSKIMMSSRVPLALVVVGLLAACSQSADLQSGKGSATAATSVPAAHSAAVINTLAAEPLPLMTVHKSPTCGCCGLWVDQMQGAGFSVNVVPMDDLNPLKIAMGVPPAGGSCHTAIVGGYFIEGHVPAADIQRLLSERPAARGLTVPGMVVGSPGMEVPSGEVQPYTVYLVDLEGNSSPYSHHGR
jgi:hypothetical protein